MNKGKRSDLANRACSRLVFLVALQFCFLPAALADQLSAAAGFARVDRYETGGARALQIAINRYVPAARSDVRYVDLIGAVHIADKAYYAELNERFRDYDVLLFELVAADATLAESPESHGDSLLTSMQAGLKNALGLSHQLEEINYAAHNFVHADLSPDQLLASMEMRGESLYVYFWRLFYAAIEDYARDPLGLGDLQIASQLVANPEEDALKIALAHEMVRATQRGDFLGNDEGSALIDARNARAIEVLREELAKGARRVGIFYGAAHMVDLDKRLVEELGMRRKQVEWADAWVFKQGSPEIE